MSGVYHVTTTCLVDDEMASKTSHTDRNKYRKIGFLVALLVTCLVVGIVALLWNFLGSTDKAGDATNEETTTSSTPIPQSSISQDKPVQRSDVESDVKQPYKSEQTTLCSCEHPPPVLEVPSKLDWDGQSRSAGESLSYTCNNASNITTFKATCSTSCKWQIEFIQHCPASNLVTSRNLEPSCHTDDIPSSSPNLRIQIPTRLNNTVNYVCGSSANPIVVQQAMCVKDGKWELLFKKSFEQLSRLHCRCVEDPPKPLAHIHLRWNGDQHIGAAVQYVCSSWQDNADVVATGICSSYLEWEISIYEPWDEIADKHCTCKRSPPLPLSPIRIDGASENYFGSIVKYVCGSAAKPIRVQTAVCTPPGVWEFEESTSLDVLSLKYCTCGDLPAPPSAVAVEWNGEFHVGATAEYICSLGDPQVVIQSATCSDDLNWKFIKNMSWDTIITTSCTCTEPPPQPPPALRLQWDVSNNTYGSIAVYVCDSTKHPVFVKLIQCLPSGNWDKIISKSLETLAMKHCSCSDPPEAPPPLSQIRNDDRLIGTKIIYVCDAKQTEEFAVQVAVCTDELDWHLSYPFGWMEIIERNCTCKLHPPMPPPPVRFKWNQNNKFGSTILYTCGVNIIMQSAECVSPGFWSLSINSTFEFLIKERCSCSLGPPQPSLNTLSLYWDGEKGEGTTVVYKCNWKGDPDLNVIVMLAVCSEELEWRLTTQKSWSDVSILYCTCDDTPPLPPLPLKLEWVPSNNTVGKTATYTCGTANSPIVVQTAKCFPGGHWKMTIEMSFDALITKYCTCLQDPPHPPQPLIAQWNGNRRIGSTVHYACNGENEPDVILTAVCTGTLNWRLSNSMSWQSLIARHCKCKDAPPIPPKPLRIEHEIYTAYGTTINYICGPQENPVIVQTAYCSALGKWELANDHRFEELINVYCKCHPSPPKPPPFVAAKWDGGQHFGSVVKYHCDSEIITSTIQTAVCNVTLQWEFMSSSSWSDTFNEHCICKEDPPPSSAHILLIKPENSSFGSVATYLCEFSGLDIILQTAVCSTSGQWRFTVENSLDELLTSNCMCSEDPPQPPQYVVRQWNGRRLIGSSASYKCQWASVSYTIQNAVCSPGTLTWDFTKKEPWEEVVAQNCECRDSPPIHPDAVIINWDWSLRKFGTKLTYRCNKSRTPVVAMIINCSVNKTWEVEYNTICGCPQEPPELEYPVERMWDGSARHFGTRVKYLCSRSETAPVFQEAICSDSRVWEINIYGSCVCGESLSLPPEPVQLENPGNNSVGSIANYTCGDDENDIIIQSAVCSLTGKWQFAIESSFEELSMLNCVCPEDPLPPPEHVSLIKPPNNFFGSVAKYLCKVSDLEIVVQTAVCKSSGKWQLTVVNTFDNLIESSCLCNDDPPAPPDNVVLKWNSRRLIGSSANYECGWKKVSYVVQTVVCSTALTWELQKNGTWEQLFSQTCECLDLPPVNPEANISNWDGYAKKMGTQLIYNCKKSKEVVVAMVVMCSTKKTWEIEYDAMCGCPEHPPEPNFPVKRMWDGRSKEFGTQIEYLCSGGTSAPVFQVATCNDSRLWEFKVLSSCVCDDLPVISTDLLKLQQPVSNAVGSIVNYICGGGENVVVVQTAVCSPTGKWKFSTEKSFESLVSSKCVCIGDPPSPPQHMKMRWDGSRLTNSSAQYECQWEEVARPVQSAVCSPSTLMWELTRSKTWEELVTENCECVDFPPPNFEHTSNNWDGVTRRMGAQIVYMCENSLQPIVAKVVYCSARRIWEVEYEESCGCSDDPPEINEPFMRLWDEHTKGFYTRVKYFCADSIITPVFQEATCNESRLWEIRAIRKCVCTGDPPRPPAHVLQLWDSRRFMNATIQYECKYNDVSYNLQTAVCSPITLKWEFTIEKTWETLLAENCECGGNPPGNSEHTSNNWNGLERWMGTQIIYNCINSLELIVGMIVYCSASRIWKVEYEESCGCSEDPPEMNAPVVRLWDGQSHGFLTKVKYFCTDDHISPLFQVAICNDSRAWQVISTSSCDCTGDPPLAMPPVTNDWDNYTRHFGVNITYFCSEKNTKAIQKVVQCGYHLDWNTIVEYSCYCSDDPPIAAFPIDLVWNNDTHVGTVVGYRCSASTLSPVFQWATCSHKRQWELNFHEDLTTLHAKHCQCVSEPPLPPSPSIRKWNKTQTFIGSRVYYTCSEGFASPEFQWATCSYSKDWEFDIKEDFSTLISTTCKCNSEPPEPRRGLHWNWDPNVSYIGSSVQYYCGSNDKTNLTALTATCEHDRTWKLSSTESWLKLIVENCDCPDAPKTADDRVEVSWDGYVNRVGSVVQYWCDYELAILNMKLICTEHRNWVTVYNKSCDVPWIPAYISETTSILTDTTASTPLIAPMAFAQMKTPTVEATFDATTSLLIKNRTAAQTTITTVEATSLLSDTTSTALTTDAASAQTIKSTEILDTSPMAVPTAAPSSSSPPPVTSLKSRESETTAWDIDTDEPGHFCLESWDSLSGEMCLLLRWEPMTNEQAQATCLSLGATLLEIYRKAEDDLVKNYLQSKATNDHWFWHVGFSSELKSVYWRSGHKFGSYSNFQSKLSSSGKSGRSCGAVSLVPRFSWMNVGCEDQKAPFICRPNYDFLGYSVIPFKPSKTRTKIGSISECVKICKDASPFASLQEAVCMCFSEIPNQIDTLTMNALQRPLNYQCEKLIPCAQITSQTCGCKNKAAIYMSGFAVLTGCFEGSDEKSKVQLSLTFCVKVCVSRGRAYAMHDGLNNMCTCSNKLLKRNRLLPFDDCFNKNLQQPISHKSQLTQIYRLPSSLGKEEVWIPPRKTQYGELRMAYHEPPPSSKNTRNQTEKVEEISTTSVTSNNTATTKEPIIDIKVKHKRVSKEDRNVSEKSSFAESNDSALVLSQMEDEIQNEDATPRRDKEQKRNNARNRVKLSAVEESVASSATTINLSPSVLSLVIITIIYLLFG